MGGEESPTGVMAGYASLGSLLLLYVRGLTGAQRCRSRGRRGLVLPTRRGGTAGPAVNSFPADPCRRLCMTQASSTPAAERPRAVEEPDLIRWADGPQL